MQDRRTVLKVIGAAAAVPALGQEHAAHEAAAAVVAPKYTAKIFSKDELTLLAELTDRIIPRTDTPGAADAQVPLLIDRIANSRPQAAERWKNLLVWFSAQGQDAG